MSRLSEAINTIQQEFQERYGVEVKINLTVFDKDANDRIQTSLELAEKIVSDVAKEMKTDEYKFRGKTDHSAYVCSMMKWDLDVTVHYPLEEYTED